MGEQEFDDKMLEHGYVGKGDDNKVIKMRCSSCGRTIDCTKASEAYKLKVCRKCKKEKDSGKTTQIQ